jgi:hypothetical protein
MLHKKTIMNLVIIYVEVNFFNNNSRSLEIRWIEMHVHSIGDMHQATNLKIILLHILHLILNFECILF